MVFSNIQKNTNHSGGDVWTIRNSQITGTIYGAFDLMSSASNDGNVACDNLLQVPHGSKYAVRIGSNEEPESMTSSESQTLIGTVNWKKRAMAEKMRYTFTVTENSSLLTYKYAAVLENANSLDHNINHAPPFSVMIGETDAEGNITAPFCVSSVVATNEGLTKASEKAKTGTEITYCVECETYDDNILLDKTCESPDLNTIVCAECESHKDATNFNCEHSFITQVEEQKWFEKIVTAYEIKSYSNRQYDCEKSSNGVCTEFSYYNWGRKQKEKGTEIKVENINGKEYYIGNNKPQGSSFVYKNGKYYKVADFASSTSIDMGEYKYVWVDKEFCSKCSWKEPKPTMHYYLEEPDFTANCESHGGVCKKHTTEITTTTNNKPCYQSELSSSQLATTYYKDWTTISFDLRPYIGRKISIEVINHDCFDKMYRCGMCTRMMDAKTVSSTTGKGWCNHCNTNYRADKVYAAGPHRSYGYFTAQTQPMKLKIKNCGGDEVEVTAPEGFSIYTWGDKFYRKDKTNVAYIKRDDINESATYSVTMSSNNNDPNLVGSGSDCTTVTETFTLTKNPYKGDLDVDVACFNEVILTDETEITPIKLNGQDETPDEILYQIWSYVDPNDGKTYQIQGNPVTVQLPLLEGEQSRTHNIGVMLVTANDCRINLSTTATVNRRPEVEILGDPTICNGEEKELQLAKGIYTGSNATQDDYKNWKGNVYDYQWVDEANNTLKQGGGEDGTKLTISPVKGSNTYFLNVISEETSNQGKIRQCVYTGSHTVLVYESPNITLDADGMKLDADQNKYIDVCEGNTATINATSNMSSHFTWDVAVIKPGIDANAIYEDAHQFTSPAVTDTVTYYYYATTDKGCTGMDSVKLNKLESPDLEIEGPTQVCDGMDYEFIAHAKDLDAIDPDRYVWYFENGSSLQQKTSTILFKHDPNDNQYKLSLFGENKGTGCNSRIDTIITINPNPQLTVSPDNRVYCENEEFSLTVAGADSCTWAGTNNPSFPDVNQLSLTDKANTAKTMYEVTGYEFHKYGENEEYRTVCENKIEVPITVNVAPKAYISGSLVVCEGETFKLEGSGATSYEWYSEQNCTNKIGQGNSYSGTAQAGNSSITVYMKAYDQNNYTGCSSVTSFTLTIHKAPDFEVETDKALVCAGERVVLSATSKSENVDDDNCVREFEWDNGTISAEYTTNVSATQTFKVKGTNYFGCSSSQKEVTVVVVPNPTITTTPDNPTACEGSAVQLTASIEDETIVNGTYQDSYKWTYENSQVGTDAQLSHSPSGSGTIYYEVTGSRKYSVDVDPTASGTSSVATATCVSSLRPAVSISAAPPMTIKGYESGVCEGASITLSADGAGQEKPYTWGTWSLTSGYDYSSLPTGTTTQGDGTLQVTGNTLDDRIYAVKAIGANGCEGQTYITLKTHPKPTLSVLEDKEYCENQLVTISASLDANKASNADVVPTYSWELRDASNQSIGDASSQDVTLSLAKTTTFKVSALSQYGCQSDPVSATYIAKPYPKIMNDASNSDYVCTEGKDLNLKVAAQNGVTYLWESLASDKTTSNTNEFSVSQNTLKNATSGISNYNVNLKITKDGCTTDTTYMLTVSIPPAIYITGTTSVCANQTVTLTAKGGSTGKYEWSTQETTDQIKPTIAEGNNSFHVSGEDAKGCRATSVEYIVTGTKAPTITITTQNNVTEVCQGDAIGIQAGGANSYSWKYTSNNVTKNYACTDCGNINPVINEDVVYTVMGEDGAGCTGTAQVKITAKQTPVLSITTGKDVVCKNTTTTLTAINSNANIPVNMITWEWDDDKKSTQSSITSDVIANNRNYTVTATANGCEAQASTTIQVYPDEQVGIDKGVGYVCEGGKLSVSAIGGSGAESDYVWTRSDDSSWEETGQSITLENVNQDITITLNAKTTNGCPATPTEAEISYIASPKVTISKDNDSKIFCPGGSLKLTASGGANDQMSANGWTWYLGSTELDGKTNSYQITNMTTGQYTYKVKGTNTNGCESQEVSVDVNVAKEPNLTLTASEDPICRNLKETITAQTTETNATISWQGKDAEAISRVATFDTILSIAKEYTFTFELTNTDNNCKTSQSISVNVQDIPTVSLTSVSGLSSVCEGEEIELNAIASGANNITQYDWQTATPDANDGSKATLSPTSSANEAIVKVFDGKCWSEPASYKVGINAKPTILINGVADGSDKTCLNSKIDLKASGAADDNYTWYVVSGNSEQSMGNGITYSPTITSETKFKATGNSVNGCPGEAYFTVSPKDLPTFTVSDVNVCDGQPATLQFSNVTADNLTISWQGGSTTISPSGQTASYTTDALSASRLFTIEAELDGCKSEKKNVNANVLALPDVQISCDPLDRAVCATSGELKLTATGGNGVYTWAKESQENPVLTISQTSETAGIAIADRKAGTFKYNVSSTGSNGCIGSNSIEITIHPAPSVTVTAKDNAVCYGSDAELTANPTTQNGAGINSYVWYDDQDNQIGLGEILKPTIEKASQFKVSITDANGCVATSAITNINVNPLPQPKWDPVTVCKGSDATVTLDKGSAITKIEFSDGTTINANSRTFSEVNKSETFDIKVYDANLCSKDTFMTINMDELPVISGDSLLDVCSGEKFKVKAIANNCTISWKQTEVDNAGATVNAQQEVEGSITINNQDPAQSYRFTATATSESGAKCSNTKIFEVNVHKIGTNSITADNSVVVDKNNYYICEGTTFKLSSSNAFSRYEWIEEGNDNVLDVNREATFSPTNTQTYELTAFDDYGCSVSSEITINVIKKPDFEFDALTQVCPDETTEVKLINYTPTNTTYKWTIGGKNINDGGVVQSFMLPAQTNITVVAENTIINSCRTDKSTSIAPYDKPSFDILTDKQDICAGESIEFSATNNDYQYQWYAGAQATGTVVSTNKSYSVDKATTQNVQSITYTAVATNSNSCSSVETKTITVKPIAQFNLIGSGTACEGIEVVVKGEGGDATNFMWLDANKNETGITVNQQTFTIPVGSDANFQYSGYLVGWNSNNCPDTVQYNVTKGKAPSILVNKNEPICSGNSPVIEIGGTASTIEWYEKGVEQNAQNLLGKGNYSEEISSIKNKKLTTDKTYVLVGYLGETGTCKTSEEVTVKVYSRPSATLTIDKKDCI
jgi:hypothetical protein